MRLSRELTLNQALRAIGEAGFDMKFRILWGHTKWAIVLVHQQGEKNAHIDGEESVGRAPASAPSAVREPEPRPTRNDGDDRGGTGTPPP